MEQIFLNEEQKRQHIKNFIKESKEKKSFNKEEIQFYEFLIVEFNHLKKNLDYTVKNIGNGNFNFEIKLKKEVKNIEYLDEFICSFLKQKKKDVIEEMKIFLLEFYAENYNFLLKKYNKYFKEISQTSYDIDIDIDFLKQIINNSEKKYIVKAKSLSSLSKKVIFNINAKIDNKEEEFTFYGNKTINEINKYLNNFINKNKDENKDFFEDFKIKLICDKNEMPLDE
jgi:phage terminase small subunit